MHLGSTSARFVLLLGLVAAASFTGPPASAANPSTPATVRADILPAPQINGVVWKQVIAGNVVYAGGEFTQARPFGVASGGSGTVSRSNMLAYSLTSGALDANFKPTFNGKVSDMAVTPDGTKLVVGGSFTKVNNVTRNRVAVFDLPAGSLNSTNINVNGPVKAVGATNSTIFLGGSFSTVQGKSRPHVGSVAASGGALLPLKIPVDNNTVTTLVVTPDGSQIVIGGNFTSVGGSSNPGYGLYRANALTGAGLPLPVNSEIRDADTRSSITRLSSDGTSFYGVGYAYHSAGGVGNFEGMFQASWSTGALVNLEDCHGDSYDVAPVGDVVYVSSHNHYCGNSGGFPQTQPFTMYHSTAWTKTTQGTNTRDRYGYPDHPGTPRPGILPWFPTYVNGTYTGNGSGQATWAVTGNSNYVVYGGEFLKVNNVSQQGIVRFGVRAVAPNKSGPRALNGTTFALTASSPSAGQVKLSWPPAWDRDDYTLTYRLYRNGTQIYSTSQGAFFWTGKSMSYTDTGQAGGSKPSYVVRAVDPDGNTLSSAAVSVTVNGAQAKNKLQQVGPADLSPTVTLVSPTPTPSDTATPGLGAVLPTPTVGGSPTVVP